MTPEFVLIGAALLIIGFVVGRVTAPRQRTTVTYEPPRSRASAKAPSIDAGIEASLRAGNRIEAIRRYRELNGTGLKEAKDAVEALEARLKR
jgi:large subunit ribosomal protein L7/L12